MVHPSGREIWRMFLCFQGQSVFAAAVHSNARNTAQWWQFSGRVIRFRYRCTANLAKDCTMVALRRVSSVLTIVVHPDGAR